MSRNLRLRKPEQSLARSVFGGPVENAERIGCGSNVAVELQRLESARDERGMNLANVPLNPRVWMDAERTKERGKVHSRHVQPSALEPPSFRERINDRVG